MIRAKTPKNFDINIHTVLSFKRENYDKLYTLDIDKNYTYKGEGAECSIHYSEDALLGLPEFTVIDFCKKEK